jgi:hypothetical protein|tara:strand:+ start:7016 stop:7615 length:600 start_codon:yes stop_codon:yes gene_type:complete
MITRDSEITNFIGVFDNYLPANECKKAIQLFEEQDKFNKTLDRMAFENSPYTEKKDKQAFLGPHNISFWWESIKPLIVNFELAFQHYNNKTGILNAYGIPHFHYTDIKIQKTLPTEGYHLWHIEHMKGFDNEARAVVFSIYLNDVEEGGETEFLHFSKRVKPKTGRIVIWPAGFPYVHRGNPPLKGEKYIITSWLKLRP